VFYRFNDNELLLNYLFIFIIFVFMELVNSIRSGFVTIMLVSSAKSTDLLKWPRLLEDHLCTI
jgi:hypothetical protein